MKTLIASMFLCLALVPAAVAFAAPAKDAKPLAKCNDGKTMYSSTGEHRGACSGHKGVASWLDGSPAPAHKGKTTDYR